MTMTLEKFNPQKQELTVLADKYKGLVIAGIDDSDGYKAVDTARKELKKMRVGIQKQGKEYRAEALQFQKKVIELEKDLVSIIEPIEKELSDKQDAIDTEKEKISRMRLLPTRKESLEKIGVALDDDAILGMDPREFTEFYNAKNAEYIAEEARKLAQEKARIEEDKRNMEEEKRREEEKRAEAEKARIETEEKAKRVAEEAQRKHEMEIENMRLEAEREREELRLAAEREREELRLAAEREKQAEIERLANAEEEKREAIEKIRRESEEKELARIEAEKTRQRELEEAAKQAEEERARAEKNARYKEWAKKLPYGVEIRREGDTFTAWQKIAEIIIR